jgi:hypothetical protein
VVKIDEYGWSSCLMFASPSVLPLCSSLEVLSGVLKNMVLAYAGASGS